MISQNHRITTNHFAPEVGLSTQTISQVIYEHTDGSLDNCQRILDIIEKLEHQRRIKTLGWKAHADLPRRGEGPVSVGQHPASELKTLALMAFLVEHSIDALVIYHRAA